MKLAGYGLQVFELSRVTWRSREDVNKALSLVLRLVELHLRRTGLSERLMASVVKLSNTMMRSLKKARIRGGMFRLRGKLVVREWQAAITEAVDTVTNNASEAVAGEVDARKADHKVCSV